jgi:hypothetical protein
VKLEELKIGMRVKNSDGTEGTVVGIYAEGERPVCFRPDIGIYFILWCKSCELTALAPTFEIPENIAKAILLEAGYRLGDDSLWCDAKSCTDLVVFQTLEEAWNDYTKSFGGAP